jgi:3-oxoacyl-[acyl-carrier-protein] synthase III
MDTIRSRIVGVGSTLAERRVTNEELVGMLATLGVETSDEWIVTRSGIRARHFAEPGTKASDLACRAARRALESNGLERPGAPGSDW